MFSWLLYFTMPQALLITTEFDISRSSLSMELCLILVLRSTSVSVSSVSLVGVFLLSITCIAVGIIS